MAQDSSSANSIQKIWRATARTLFPRRFPTVSVSGRFHYSIGRSRKNFAGSLTLTTKGFEALGTTGHEPFAEGADSSATVLEGRAGDHHQFLRARIER